VASYIAQGLASLLLAVVLRYLYRVAAYREPDTAPRIAKPLALIGPVLLMAAAIALAILQLGVIDKVLDGLPLSEDGVEDIQQDENRSAISVTVFLVAVMAALALAGAFILISRYARRVGLLSQFLGILGVIVGVILVLGPLLGQVLGALPVVQWFWLGALGAIFLGRWPGGRGPAWETGEAEPWPTAAELRAEAGGAPPPRRRGLFAPPEPREPEPDDDGPEPDDEPDRPAGTPHPRSKKRKRKRRR
jgi:MFS family permease